MYLTQKIQLNVDKPNIYDLISDINSKLSGYLTCSYDNIKCVIICEYHLYNALAVLLCSDQCHSNVNIFHLASSVFSYFSYLFDDC